MFLVVYTDAAASASPGINAEIQLAIDETNQSYINSGINQRLRLVHQSKLLLQRVENMHQLYMPFRILCTLVLSGNNIVRRRKPLGSDIGLVWCC